MRAYANMPMTEFIAELRDAAIQAKAGSAVIDCIDRLNEIEDNSGEIEILEDEIDNLRSDIADLKEGLENA